MGLINLFLQQEAIVLPYLRQGSGEPIYGEAERRKCRLERGANLKVTYKNADGALEQVVANALMFCVGEPIKPKSKVTVNGNDYIVINCVIAAGFNDSHLEVYLE
jgi:hypothetical protein